MKYYIDHALEYFERTKNLDMNELYAMFEKYLKPNSTILDAGCAFGRDSNNFKKKGYKVKSFDESSEFVKIGKEKLGLEIEQASFLNYGYKTKVNGIWACASLLHLKESDLKTVFSKMSECLKPKGVIYCSFKYGTFEGKRGDRFFIDFNEEKFKLFIDSFSDLKIKETWVSGDVRSEKANEQWLNVILQKETNGKQ